jgi:hypothetical protein
VTAPPATTLLSEAPVGRHFAQFHRDPAALAECLYVFVESGLRRGNSVAVLASPENGERLQERLGASSFHPRALRSSGQLEIVEAKPLLAEFMSDAMPEWGKFRAALSKILERIQPYGRGIRVYCEMASTLWSDGNHAAAVRLEELWNALSRVHFFALFSGYLLDTQREESFAGPLEELGRQFTDILGTNEDEQFGAALDRASKEIFGIALSQMAGTKMDGARPFPSGLRTMLWVKRNLPMSTSRLAEQARRFYRESRP